MSGYSQTSRDAYAKVDITAGQRKILDYFYTQAPNAAFTRQELVVRLAVPINIITARCHELLEAGRLESLPAVEGRHPIRLATKAAQQTPCYSEARPEAVGLTRPSATHDTHSRCESTVEDYREGEHRVQTKSAVAAPRIAHVLPPTFNLSEDAAKKIITDPKNYFYEQAKARLEISSRSKPLRTDTGRG